MDDNNEVRISRDDLKRYESLSRMLEQCEQKYSNYISAVILVSSFEKHIEISRRADNLTQEDRVTINRILDKNEGRYIRT